MILLSAWKLGHSEAIIQLMNTELDHSQPSALSTNILHLALLEGLQSPSKVLQPITLHLFLGVDYMQPVSQQLSVLAMKSTWTRTLARRELC